MAISTVRSRAPVRVSFAGGGTDVSPYAEEHGGCVVSATIDKYSFTSLGKAEGGGFRIKSGDSSEVVLQSLEDAILDGKYDLAKIVLMELKPHTGLELFFRNDVPPRSGLGSSAAGFVSMIGAFNFAFSMKLSLNEIAQLAFNLERNRLGVKGGKQDQFASAYGGMNFLEFSAGKVKVMPLRLSKGTLFELEKNMLLFFVGERKENGTDIIADQNRSLSEKKGEVLAAFDSAKQVALDMKSALKSADLEKFGSLLGKGWAEKKKYSRMISNPFIDSLYENAMAAGAIGGKITGAGGGGYMVFYCQPDKEIAVRERLVSLGARHVPFSFESGGLQTWRVG